MTQQNINFGTTRANDGEDLFSAFTKIQANFSELYTDATSDAAALAAHIADTSAAHDASAISFTQSGTGAVERTALAKMRDIVSVLDFIPVALHASIADGSNATALQTYIQAAATAASGKTLYFPPGTYLESASTAAAAVTLPTAGIRLQGAGKHLVTIKMAAATAAVMFGAVDADKIEIDGIGFDGQNTSRLAWQRALVLRGVQDVAITNCRFYRVGDGGILMALQNLGGSDAIASGTRQPKRVRVSGNEFVDCRGTVAVVSKYTGVEELEVTNNAFRDSCSIGISIESEDGDPAHIAKRTVITGNRISGCSYTYTGGLSAIAWGISYGELTQDCVIANNIIDGVAGDTIAAGINISTSPSQDDSATKRAVASANTIRNVTGATGRAYGVLLQAGDTSTTDMVVNGNVIADCEDGIGIDCDAGAKTLGYVRGVSIVGNTITDCTEFGILHLTTGSSGSLPLIDSVISGNVIRGSASHAITGFFKECVISGNKIKAAGGSGLTTLTGSDKLTISGNNITECQADGFNGVLNNSTVTGNTSMNNGQGGGTTYGWRITGGGNNLVHGNTFSDDQGSPSQSHGFRSANATDSVFGNDCIGNATSAIFGGVAGVNDGVFDLAMNRSAASGGNWLEDPGADRIRFWDESSNVEAFLSLPAAGITISGTALALADDLAALEGMSGTGVVARTASNTYAQRTVTGTANEISVSNGDGVSGNPTLSLPSTVDLSGKTLPGLRRIIANSAVQSSHTGNTSETTLATVTVPAGAMGPNGVVYIWVLYSWTNNGNNKTPRVRWNGTGGTIVHGFTATTSNGEQALIIIRNRNSASSQITQTAGYAGIGTMTAAHVTDTVNTTSAVDIVMRGILGNSADSIAIEAYTVEVQYGA